MKDRDQILQDLKDYVERKKQMAMVLAEDDEPVLPCANNIYVDAFDQILRWLNELEKAPPKDNQYARLWYTLQRHIEDKEAKCRQKCNKAIGYTTANYYDGMARVCVSILKEMDEMMDEEGPDDND